MSEVAIRALAVRMAQELDVHVDRAEAAARNLIERGLVAPPQSRAQMLMLLAAKYIRKYAPDHAVHYDEADCEGSCLADDLEIEAENV